jgi:hypothetical protein
MGDIVLKITDVLEECQTPEKQYRIIYIRESIVVLCEMNITKLNLFYAKAKELTDKIILKEIRIVREQRFVYDIDSFDEKERNEFEMRRSLIREVVKNYGPTYMELIGRSPKKVIKNLIDKYKIPKSLFWRYIRFFLQSGCDEYSLVDKRYVGRSKKKEPYKYSVKTGRPYKTGIKCGIILTNETKNHFKEAMEMYKSGRAMTIENAFDSMNNRYYSLIEENNGCLKNRLIPVTQRPTIGQFYNFVKDNLSEEEKDAIKTSKQEQRNNKRLLLSDSLKDVYGPGDLVEMDEAEVDVSLVSTSNPGQTVGRPIFYVMKDSYTRLIIAVSVAFNNNSVEGITNCFINLGEDKVEFCKRFGFDISESMWPSNFLPKRIRCDRGSEYRSEEARRIFNELNISRELVTGGTGSLKGLVEQVFHQLHCAQNPLLESKGLIEKRHDSKHHKEAMLSVIDYTKIVINYALHYNQSSLKDYPLTKDMIDKNIKPIPIELWKYGCEKFGKPIPITNNEQYAYTLMTPIKNAKLSKRGIKANDKLYINREDNELLKRMYNLQNKSEDFECRLDVRHIGKVYYLRNNRLMVAELNPDITGNADFSDCTLAEWKEYQQELDIIKHEGKELNDQLRAKRLAINEQIIESAQKSRFSSTTNIKKEREKEKQAIQRENSIEKRLLNDTLESANVEDNKSVNEQNIEVDSNDFTDINFDVLEFKSAMEEFKERN